VYRIWATVAEMVVETMVEETAAATLAVTAEETWVVEISNFFRSNAAC